MEFVLTGRPASRTTSRLYDEPPSTSSCRRWRNADYYYDDDGGARSSSNDEGDDSVALWKERKAALAAPKGVVTAEKNMKGVDVVRNEAYYSSTTQNRYGHDRSAPRRVATGYETVPNTAMITQRNQSQRRLTNPAASEHAGVNIPKVSTYQAYHQVMTKPKNKYRPRFSKPSECDDSLFGKSNEQSDYKEWKAPWDTSRTTTPLVFDSTDRAGHYSPNRQDAVLLRQSHSAKSNQRRPWK